MKRGAFAAVFALSLSLATSAFAFWYGGGAGGYCPTCNMLNSPWSSPMFTYSMPSFYWPSYSPWWTPYGAMSYPNFYYPGAWSSYGMNGMSYPGAGHGFMGKPNVYVKGPAGAQVKLRVGFPDGGNILASVPAHGEDGWSAKLEKDGTLRVGASKYDYLFYDYRFNLASFQNDRGFCGGGELILRRMGRSLVVLGFEKREVMDFVSYWQVKLPRAKSYCVYPQEARNLDPVAPLEISPRPESVTRIGFLVIPMEPGVKIASARFGGLPTQDWTAARRALSSQAESKPGASDAPKGIVVREWGVGFLRGDQPVP